MQIYLAPMEGITGYIVRNAFSHQFGGIDKCFTPFIPAAKRMNHKILRDLAPVNNEGIRLVPQLIGGRADEIRDMIRQLQDLGFSEININLGCPSGTVVSKNRGSGMLKDPQELDRFLGGIYDSAIGFSGSNGSFDSIDSIDSIDSNASNASNIAISIKTRIGFTDLALWPEILRIYRKYPIYELIIHPRLRSEMYGGFPHLEAFQLAYDTFQNDTSPFPVSIESGTESDPMPGKLRSDFAQGSDRLCYNGDIWDMHCYQNIRSQFPAVTKVMIGRGLLGRPYLA